MRVKRVAVSGLVCALALAVVPVLAAPQQWKDVLKTATQAISQKSASTKTPGILSNTDVVDGLKQALAQGSTKAIASLGKSGGFWNNAKVRIPLPSSLQKVGEVARDLGQGAKVDAFQRSLNSAAEKAVPQVADVFGSAIRNMSVKDAKGILTGGDHAATDYFRRTAGKELASRIEPIVAKATDSVGVTAKYKALLSSAKNSQLGGILGKLGGKPDSGSLNIDQYVTNEAIDGLFTEIGNQEKLIREDPAARTTALLKKVFAHQ